MRKAILLLGVFALGLAVSGCNSKEGKQGVAPQKSAMPGTANDKELVLKYLQGIQSADKSIMYAATNLTPATADQCKEKLIHQSKEKLADAQRKECEKALEISGEIDFYVAKVGKNLPKSATFQIVQSKDQSAPADTRDTVNSIKITYNDKKDALKDKTGQYIKEMIVPLHQITQSVNGSWVNEFKFGRQDEFQVVAYY